MTELAQALVGGILIGGLYVAISIGFSLSFGVLDVVDLAVGMWVVLGAFAAIVASEKLGIDASAAPARIRRLRGRRVAHRAADLSGPDEQ